MVTSRHIASTHGADHAIHVIARPKPWDITQERQSTVQVAVSGAPTMQNSVPSTTIPTYAIHGHGKRHVQLPSTKSFKDTTQDHYRTAYACQTEPLKTAQNGPYSYPLTSTVPTMIDAKPDMNYFYSWALSSFAAIHSIPRFLLRITERTLNAVLPCPSIPDPHTMITSYAHTLQQSPTFLPQLSDFIKYILVRSSVHTVTLILSLIYLNRLQHALPKNARGCYGTRHRLFLASLMIASKYLDDQSELTCRFLSDISQGMFTVHEVRQMEVEFLGLLSYALHVDPVGMSLYLRQVAWWCQKEEEEERAATCMYLHSEAMYSGIACPSYGSLMQPSAPITSAQSPMSPPMIPYVYGEPSTVSNVGMAVGHFPYMVNEHEGSTTSDQYVQQRTIHKTQTIARQAPIYPTIDFQ